MSPGTTYSWTVTALDANNGESAPSSPATGTTTGSSPVCFTSSNYAHTQAGRAEGGQQLVQSGLRQPVFGRRFGTPAKNQAEIDHGVSRHRERQPRLRPVRPLDDDLLFPLPPRRHYRSKRASSFAAQMKSFSESPPTAWVEYVTRHWL